MSSVETPIYWVSIKSLVNGCCGDRLEYARPRFFLSQQKAIGSVVQHFLARCNLRASSINVDEAITTDFALYFNPCTCTEEEKGPYGYCCEELIDRLKEEHLCDRDLLDKWIGVYNTYDHGYVTYTYEIKQVVPEDNIPRQRRKFVSRGRGRGGWVNI